MNKIIDGRYEIIEPLGKGGFGTTFLAKDTKRPGDPICVVKKFTPVITDPSNLKKAKELFDREANTLEQLGKHPQIPQLLAHIKENQEFYIIQEYIEGHDLSEELPIGVRKDENFVIQLLQEILEVLAFVHENKVIHRDLKPSNIRRRALDGQIFLIDFGVVKEMGSQIVNNQVQQKPTVAGTPAYMPMEQHRGKPQFSSDVYALGIIAIQALTGLSAEQLEEDNATGKIIWYHQAKNTSTKLAEILDIMVDSDFSKRYQSAGSALQALQNISNSESKLIQPSTVNLNLPNQIKSRKVSIKVATIAITGIVISVIILIIGRVTQCPENPERKDLLVYENSQYGIRIKYPQDWAREDLDNVITKELVNFVAPKQSNVDNFLEKLTTIIDRN